MKIYNVIVIGGGAAGLAAMQRLIEKGMQNCLLLEAQEYFGGRIRTIKHGPHYLEYGAQWVHGEEGNAVYELADKYNHFDKEFSLKQTGVDETKFVREDSSLIEDDIISKFKLLMANLSESAKEELLSYKDSIGKYYTEKFMKNNELGEIGSELLDWEGKLQSIVDGAASWFEPLGVGSTVYQECPGNPFVNWTNGYQTLIDILKEDVPDEILRLNSPVVKIIWNYFLPDSTNQPKVQVELSSGEILFGDHVILTPSLAVLKDSHETLFKPPLPCRKIEAIQGLGINVVDIIYLEFPYHWWDDCDGFSFLKNSPIYDFNQQNWEEGICGFYEVYNQPKMLYAWLNGHATHQMESCSLPDVKDRCMRLLKRYLGVHYTIPDPTWWNRSTWHTNPFIQGSYSFRSVTSEAMGVTAKDLAAPLCVQGIPVVCFAGEATHHKFYSTVHGAVESGWREADRILQYKSSGGGEKRPEAAAERSFEVVVVGAGASGLAAAKELEGCGVESVLILEATDRIGGRVRTLTTPSAQWFDLGAQWIHGQLGNLLYETCAPLGLIDGKVSVDGEGEFYTDHGQLLDEPLVTEVMDVCDRLKEECRVFSSGGGLPPPSFGEFFAARFEEYLNDGGQSDRNRQLRQALHQWNVRWERIDNACDSLRQLSAKRWGDYGICEGFFNMNPKLGMSSLLFAIQEQVKAEIKFGTEVTRIDYATLVDWSGGVDLQRKDKRKPVIVHCRNGSVYECNHVIVTCSLGFLKKNLKIFSPPLPTPQATAIRTQGFGVIDKIFLEFDKPFWDHDFTGLHLVWTGDEMPDLDRTKPGTKLMNGRVVEPEDFWYKAITSFDPVCGHGSMLCGWIGGAEAEFMEGLPEDEVASVCLSLIQRFTGREDIPAPVRVYRSQWAKDPFFQGSYSYRSCEGDNSPNFIEDLNTPVYASGPNNLKVPVLSLAGEANSETSFSTIHGALTNGASQATHYGLLSKRLKGDDQENMKSKI